MAIDRYVSVKYPLEAASICTPKRSWIMATVTCGALIVYNIPYAIFSSVCYSISRINMHELKDETLHSFKKSGFCLKISYFMNK